MKKVGIAIAGTMIKVFAPLIYGGRTVTTVEVLQRMYGLKKPSDVVSRECKLSVAVTSSWLRLLCQKSHSSSSCP